MYCGTVSGRDVDKFANSDLVPLPARIGLMGVGMYRNEEGDELGMLPNFMVRGSMIAGPVVLFAILGTCEHGLDGPQIRAINETFGWDHLDVPALRLRLA